MRTSTALLAAAALLTATGTAAQRPAATVQEALARCGIDRGQIAQRFDREVQSEVAIISGGGYDDAVLGCAADALAERLAIARFEASDTDSRFGDLWGAAMQRLAESHARQWLSERGLLDTLPRYDPERQTLAEFAVALERLCGIAPGAAFTIEAGMLTFVDTDRPTFPEGDSSTCLLQAGVAASTGSAALAFGFVGNEAPAPAGDER